MAEHIRRGDQLDFFDHPLLTKTRITNRFAFADYWLRAVDLKRIDLVNAMKRDRRHWVVVRFADGRSSEGAGSDAKRRRDHPSG